MILEPKKILMPALGIALAAQAVSTGCNKDDDSNTDLLVGEWQLVELNGTPVDDQYTYTFEFERDLDFRSCYAYSNYSYCYSGEWKWKNSDEDEIEIEYIDDGSVYELNLEVTKLEKTVMEGRLEVGSDVQDVEFVKL